MEIKEIYLKSLHPYNFRHSSESPKVVGFVMLTPVDLTQRPCFKVEYESDGKIDYIAHETLVRGEWCFIDSRDRIEYL